MTTFPAVKKAEVNLLKEKPLAESCVFHGGKLMPALTPKVKGTAPENVFKVFRSNGVSRFFAVTETAVFVSRDGVTFSNLMDCDRTSSFIVEEIIDGEIRAEIIAEDLVIIHTPKGFTTDLYGANLSCGVMHCGRLFGADSENNYILRWSGEGGVLDWEVRLYGAGYLEFTRERGKILNIEKVGDCLILVREYGLTKLKMYGTPENFSQTDTGFVTGRIIKDTACAIGNKLYFMTSAGLRVYNGEDISALSYAYEGDISAPCHAVAYDGAYFLSCESKTFGKGIFCLEPDGNAYFIGAECEGLCVSDGVYFVAGGVSYTLGTGENVKAVYKGVNFGTHKNKTLTKISSDCSGGAVTVECGAAKRTFKGQSVRPRMRGKTFDITVVGKGEISCLSAVAEVSVGI